MTDEGKFDINIETDKGKEEILRCIKNINNFKDFDQLLNLMKKNKEVVDETLEFLTKGRLHSEKTDNYYSLIRKKKNITDYIMEKKMWGLCHSILFMCNKGKILSNINVDLNATSQLI